jgi:hypothetical protein
MLKTSPSLLNFSILNYTITTTTVVVVVVVVVIIIIIFFFFFFRKRTYYLITDYDCFKLDNNRTMLGFSFTLPRPDRLSAPPSLRTGALTPGVKRPGRETDHSLPRSVDVKNEYRATPPLSYVFIAWCLIKQ